MTLERAAEVFTVVNFVVIGLSHLLRPRDWVDLFVGLRSLGRTGVFINGMLSLMVGSIIVAMHNVWHGWPIVVTLIGWLQVMKALSSLTFPDAGMKSLMRVSIERAWEFQAAGALFLVISGLVAYSWL